MTDLELLALINDRILEAGSDFTKIANDLNANFGANISLPLDSDIFSALLDIIDGYNSSGQTTVLREALFTQYVVDINFENFSDNIKNLFKGFSEKDIFDRLRDLFIPKIIASIPNLDLALTFPRTWLKPL